jgi:hypothetical protein
LLGADSEILAEQIKTCRFIRERFYDMDTALTRLTVLVDQVLAVLAIPTTEDNDINAISDKIEAALAAQQAPVAPAAPAAVVPGPGQHVDANGVLIDDATGQPVAQ